MKKTLLLLTLTFLISCSSQSNNKKENNNPSDGHKLVKREYVSDNHNIEYRYNERSLLSKIMDIQLEEEINDVVTFKYDSKDNVIERQFESNNSNYKSINNYSYDNDDRLKKAVSVVSGSYSRTITQLFSYSDNIVTVDINSDNRESNTVVLEMNNSKLVTKMSKNGLYSTLDYDSNGNISKISTFDNDSDLLYTHSYSYDNKTNPFYGQLESIYRGQ